MKIYIRIIISLFFVFGTLFTGDLAAQVTAKYNDDKTKITIYNNTRAADGSRHCGIVIFNKDGSKGKSNIKKAVGYLNPDCELNNISVANTNGVCGLTRDYIIKAGGQLTIAVNCDNISNIYYYPVEDFGDGYEMTQEKYTGITYTEKIVEKKDHSHYNTSISKLEKESKRLTAENIPEIKKQIVECEDVIRKIESDIRGYKPGEPEYVELSGYIKRLETIISKLDRLTIPVEDECDRYTREAIELEEKDKKLTAKDAPALRQLLSECDKLIEIIKTKSDKEKCKNLLTGLNNLKRGIERKLRNTKIYFTQYGNSVSKLEGVSKNLNELDTITLRKHKTECEQLISDVRKAKNKKRRSSPEYKELSYYETRLNGIKSEIDKTLETINSIRLVKEKYNEEILSMVGNDEELYNEIKEIADKSVFVRWKEKDFGISKMTMLKNNYDNIVKSSSEFIEREKNNYNSDIIRDTIDNLENDIPLFYREFDDNYDKLKERIEEGPPYLLITIIILGAILVVVAVIFYARNYIKGKSNAVANEMVIEPLGLEPDDNTPKNEEVKYITGLDPVREKLWSEYYEIDINSLFDSTSINYVYFSREIILKIYKFFSDLIKTDKKTTETGCFLVGRWEYADDTEKTYNISIEEIVEPSDDAVSELYKLDFGYEIEISLNTMITNMREKTGFDYVHTSWMHSHPGLGLFLSEYDLIAQSTLAYDGHHGRMLAIVLDTNSEDFDMALFSPKKDGSMNNSDIGDELKTVSLETLFEWAKSPAKFDVDRQSYYEINVNINQDNIKTILFSGSSIIDMDMALVSAKDGLLGYFYGNYPYHVQVAHKFIVVDEFSTEVNNKGKEPSGCLFLEQDFKYSEVFNKYKPIIEKLKFFAVYQAANETMYIINRNEKGLFTINENDISSEQLMNMKKWTRRRR